MCLCRICEGQKDKNGKIILLCIAYLAHVKCITVGGIGATTGRCICFCVSVIPLFLLYLTTLVIADVHCMLYCHVYKQCLLSLS